MALLGAAIVVLFVGQYNQELAIESVSFSTLGLLAGMMVLVYVTQQSGVYDFIAVKAGQFSKGNSLALVIMMSATVAILSGFLDNLTTILLIVPVTFLLADTLDINPIPLIIVEVLSANIGGAATLIGDPPNVLIGAAADLSFNDFLINNLPAVTVILSVVTVGLYFVFRKQLHVEEKNKKYVMELDAAASITDREELRRTLPVLIGTIVFFFAHQYIHIEPATVALTGAAVALLVTKVPIEKALENIEWTTIFFFIGLFVMVEGVSKTGLLRILAERLLLATGGDPTVTVLAVLWGSALLSAVLDNIPFVATMIPLVKGMESAFGGAAGLEPVWWALALGACLGGNGTLIGASANLTVAGIADRAGVPFKFTKFTVRAFPLMLVSVGIAHVYLWVRYLR